ncbi:MAG TPA: hypothetical protein VIG80_15705 [Bacillaceae bacterium]
MNRENNIISNFFYSSLLSQNITFLRINLNTNRPVVTTGAHLLWGTAFLGTGFLGTGPKGTGLREPDEAVDSDWGITDYVAIVTNFSNVITDPCFVITDCAVFIIESKVFITDY